MKIVKRSDKVAFLEVPSITGEGAGVNYRMKGFKSLSKKRNPKEYTRQYVDEAFETTDIVGISISQDFEFDQVKDSPLHDYLVDIIENEKLGSDAMVNIVQVDFSKVRLWQMLSIPRANPLTVVISLLTRSSVIFSHVILP